MTSRVANTVVTEDRWSCPTCGRTVVVTADQLDTRWCLRAAMDRHGFMHEAEKRKRIA